MQNFSKRTHNTIVRSMIGQNSILGCIDKTKLRFLYQLTQLNPDDLAYDVFIHRLYDWVFGNVTSGFLPEVYSILRKYKLQMYFHTYVHGGTLPTK